MAVTGSGDGAEPWPYKEADKHGWPTPPGVADSQSSEAELYKAKLEVRKKRTDQEIAHARADADAEIALAHAYYTAVFEVAKGSMDRARGSAETVQKASAAIVTLYTGVLALAFSVSSHPLPAKGLFAAVLLGVAILLSTAFLAFLPDADLPDRQIDASDVGDTTTLGELLDALFVRWTRSAALARSRLLRGSVIALAGAVALMPAPFVTIGKKVAAPPPIAWPAPPAVVSGDREMARTLYAAQVAEVAQERKQPIAQVDSVNLWPWLFGLALIAVLVVIVFPLSKSSCDRSPG